jgi:hypothetical protein
VSYYPETNWTADEKRKKQHISEKDRLVVISDAADGSSYTSNFEKDVIFLGN